MEENLWKQTISIDSTSASLSNNNQSSKLSTEVTSRVATTIAASSKLNQISQQQQVQLQQQQKFGTILSQSSRNTDSMKTLLPLLSSPSASSRLSFNQENSSSLDESVLNNNDDREFSTGKVQNVYYFDLVRKMIPQHHVVELIIVLVIIAYLIYYFNQISKRPKLIGNRKSKFVDFIKTNLDKTLKNRFNPLIYFWGTNPQTALFGYLQGNLSIDEMPRNKFRRQYLYVSDAQYLTSNVDLSQHYVTKSSSSSAKASKKIKTKTNNNSNDNKSFVQLQILDLEKLHLEQQKQNENSYDQLNKNIRLALKDMLSLSNNNNNNTNNENGDKSIGAENVNQNVNCDRHLISKSVKQQKQTIKCSPEFNQLKHKNLEGEGEGVVVVVNCSVIVNDDANKNAKTIGKRTLKEMDMGSSSGSSSDSGVFATSGHSSSSSTSSLMDADINSARINNSSSSSSNSNNNNRRHHNHHHPHQHHHHHHHHHNHDRSLDSNSDGSQSDTSTMNITSATNSTTSNSSASATDEEVDIDECACKSRYDIVVDGVDNDDDDDDHDDHHRVVQQQCSTAAAAVINNNNLIKNKVAVDSSKVRGSSIRKKPSEFEEFGQCALDWFKESHVHYHKNKLVALISAGMTTGSDKKYVTDTVKNLVNLGYEVCVFIRRGVGGLKLNSPKFFSPAKWRDFEAAIKSVKQQRPGAHLVAVGFSFGSIELCRYLSMSGKQSLVDAALLISCPFDPEAGGRNMRKRLLNRKIDAYLAKNLGKQLYQAMQASSGEQQIINNNNNNSNTGGKHNLAISNLNGSFVNLAKLPKIKSLVDFEDNYNRVLQNYPNSEAYADDSRLSDHLKFIETPTLCLSSEDDFMAPLKLLPVREIQLNENLCMILTKRGGHMAFIDGLVWPKKPYFAQRIIATYMEAVKLRLINKNSRSIFVQMSNDPQEVAAAAEGRNLSADLHIIRSHHHHHHHNHQHLMNENKSSYNLNPH